MADRVWQQDTNRALYDSSTIALTAKSYLCYIFMALTGRHGYTGTGLYTLDQCCDSTQVKTDGTNVFGESFDNTKWVRSNVGVRSWFVLYSNNYYLTVDFNGGNDYSNFANCKFSKVRPSGGTTSAAPTASDMTDPVYFSIDSTPRSYSVHSLLSDSGDFFIFINKVSAGYMSGCFYANHMVSLTSNIRTMTWDLIASCVWVSSGITAASFFTSTSVSRRYDNSAAATNALVNLGISGSAHCLSTIAAGGDFFMGAGTYPRLPILIYCTTLGYTGFPGRLADIEWGPELAQPKGRETGGPPYTAVLLGPCFFPFTTIPSM